MGKVHEPLKSLGPGARDLLGNAAETGELRRRLTQRQLSMLAIGGAIGVGLFLGSSVTIRLAGPGVIVSYLLGAAIALIIAYALVEMAVVHPVAGSFGVYAQTYLSPWAGFTVRATYGLVQIIAIGAEVTAVAIYFAFWFPSIPQWIWVVGVSIGLVALNALQVARFGEFEYWFAFIKVLTILVFIVVGLGLILGLGPRLAIGLSNLTAHGGFLPYGWRGVWLALTLALTSYMGVEIIAVSAGEAERPEESIPRAMRTIVFRLILFYVLAITVMLAMTPLGHGRRYYWESVRERLYRRGHSLWCKHYESGGDHGGPLKFQHRPVPQHAHAVFPVEGTIRPGMARAPQRKWRSSARPGCFDGGYGGSDIACNLCAGESIPHALRRRRRGDVFCLDHHFTDAPRVSARACSRTNRPASHAFAILSIFDMPGHRRFAGDRCEHVLCPGLAVLGSSFRAYSSADFSRLLESPARERVCARYGAPITGWLRSGSSGMVKNSPWSQP